MYRETADSGAIIGASDRPAMSFSNGWWVRDCASGSMFNLTAAHPLRASTEKPSFRWCVTEETARSQTVDCPPVCAINYLTLKIRRQLNELFVQGGHPDEIERRRKDLEQLQRDLIRRDFATVVAAGYGEYRKVNGGREEYHVLEDWSLLRARSGRIGKNAFPLESVENQYFTGVGGIRPGMRCFLNGATSGVREGIVWDQLEMLTPEHDEPTLNWIIREKGGGIFGQDGDSGAPVGLEGGLAGGTYVFGGTGEYDYNIKSPPFQFSAITSLKDTLERIKDVTGRHLEIPSEHDLSSKRDRDRYHLEKTGNKRVRH